MFYHSWYTALTLFALLTKVKWLGNEWISSGLRPSSVPKHLRLSYRPSSVPKHLRLSYKPFVPLELDSQGSCVPSVKSQTATRIRFLTSLGCTKKDTGLAKTSHWHKTFEPYGDVYSSFKFKQINQADATVLQVYYLTFCFVQHVTGASTPIIRSL